MIHEDMNAVPKNLEAALSQIRELKERWVAAEHRANNAEKESESRRVMLSNEAKITATLRRDLESVRRHLLQIIEQLDGKGPGDRFAREAESRDSALAQEDMGDIPRPNPTPLEAARRPTGSCQRQRP